MEEYVWLALGTVYNGFIDIHRTKEEHFDWLEEVASAADVISI